MSTVLLLLAGAFVAATFVNAVLLWLTCRWLRVRYPATEAAAAGVRFRRTLTLAACSLTASVVAGVTCWSLPVEPAVLVLNAYVVLAVASSVVILRVGLRVGWLRAAGVEAVWTLLGVPVAVIVGLLAFDGSFVANGEMAEGILGGHKEVVCPQCGQPFVIDASTEVPGADGEGHEVTGCTCPNCRYGISFSPVGRAAPPGFMEDPGTRRADRILTTRSLLRPATLPPERFDVVTFQPQQVDWVALKQTRGILRVVGLPGETIAIHRGDLFLLDPDAVPDRGAVVDLDFFQGQARARLVGGKFQVHTDEELVFRQGKFHILRKPPAKVLALMQPVYDHSHPPRDLPAPDYLRWVADKGSRWWNEGVDFRHDGTIDEVAWLRYRHVLRTHWGTPSLITDFTGYNFWEGAAHQLPGENWVSDLILECEADPGSRGELIMELSRGPDRFQALFDLSGRTCALFRLTNGKDAEKLGEARVKMPANNACLRFANVDERLIVWVNDRLVFGDGVAYAGPSVLVPVKENDVERPASVGVKGAAVRVKRLRLLRDVYYTVTPQQWGWGRGGAVGAADVEGFQPADATTWGHLKNAPLRAECVEAGHYFLLGDNSPVCPDSRVFAAVPEKQLVGKALLRYYPLSRFGRVE
jgi:hypothetical protein